MADPVGSSEPRGPDSAGPLADPAAQYEFSQRENLIIGQCAHRARIFGILCAVSGAMQLFAALGAAFGSVELSTLLFLVPSGGFNVLLGILLTRASTALSKVVSTTGQDVTLLMEALGQLSRAFVVQIAAAILFMLVLVSVSVAMLMMSKVLAS